MPSSACSPSWASSPSRPIRWDIHPPEWVILLEWISEQPHERDWQVLLNAAAARIWRHFHLKGKMSPVRIDLHRHGELLASSELPPEPLEDPSSQSQASH